MKNGYCGPSSLLNLKWEKLHDRIRVNSVLVGAVATHMTLEGLSSGGPESSGLSFEAGSIGRIADPTNHIAESVGARPDRMIALPSGILRHLASVTCHDWVLSLPAGLR